MTLYEHLLSTIQGQWQRQLQWHVATDAAGGVEAAETRAMSRDEWQDLFW